MTKQRWTRISEALESVMKAEDQDARLRALCREDPALGEEVRAYLDAEAHAPAFLEDTAAAFAAPFMADAEESEVDFSLENMEGERIGAYRLVRELGRGGMGQVFLAERAGSSFDQQVALKVLRKDVATSAMRERLRAERQILAQLSHPGIAQVFDGGVTEDGRPYLVLEYVEGRPIDAYCRENESSLRERLALFVEVCAAVQQAHRALVVHRDLKPSNILVTPEGHPKLLDFGIAKLLEGAEGVAAPITQTSERWMTPHYAAPEQVRSEAVTTGTDVHALGALLYELLTERRPFGDAASHEVARAVVESAPPRPSTRNARLGTDLDTIVLKALRKEPARRYASAEALAEDVERFLSERPVAARPATWTYQARKFVQRNRRPVIVALVALALVAGGWAWYVTAVAAERDRAQMAAQRAEQEAQTAEQVAGFLSSLFEAGSPFNTAGDTLTAFDLLDRGTARLDTLEAQPAVQARMAALIGDAYADLGDNDRALPLLKRVVALHRQDSARAPVALAEALEGLADFHDTSRSFKWAIPLYEEALSIRRAQEAGQAAEIRTARTMRQLSASLAANRSLDTAAVVGREALALLQSTDAPTFEVRKAQAQLANIVADLGRHDEAAALYEEALPAYREAADRDSTLLPELAKVLHNAGGLHIERGAFEEAIARSREALAIDRRLNETTHQSKTLTMRNLAIALSEAGRYDEARALWQERLDLVREHLPPGHWRIGNAEGVLASFDLLRGDAAGAEARLRAARDLFVRRWPQRPDHPWIKQADFRLGVALALQGRHEEADELVTRGAFGFTYDSWNHYDEDLARLLVDHYEALGQTKRAARYQALLQKDGEES